MRIARSFAICFLAWVLLAGTTLAAAELSETERLAGLCRVWGFLKYYHNNVSGGQLDWNKEILEMIPGVKAARDPDAFQHQLLQLIRKAGYGKIAKFTAPPADLVNIEWNWLDNSVFLTPLIAAVLKDIRDGHDGALCEYYSAVYQTGNLEFLKDKEIETLTWEQEDVRLLTLFCYWNTIEYFFPYKNLMDDSWDEILRAFIPRFQAASRELDFHLLVEELGARINDSHGRVTSSVLNDFRYGTHRAGFEVSFVEGRTVVILVYPMLLAGADIRPGDVITHVDGRSTAVIREAIRPYIPASNEPTLQRNINSHLFAGRSPIMTLTIERDGPPMTLSVPRVTYADYNSEYAATQNAIVAFKILDGNIGYINMGVLEPEQISPAIALLKNTTAIVFDVRNYPRGTIWAINEYLNENAKSWAKFHYPLIDAPGYFGAKWIQTGPSHANPDYYKGRIVILADERTQSQAEYTCMALQATGRSTLIGSQTAGADGNVSIIYLPGKIRAAFTGLGVYYPEGRQTQRIGIVPDIEIRPTIAGLRAGRDEVLERALQFIADGY